MPSRYKFSLPGFFFYQPTNIGFPHPKRRSLDQRLVSILLSVIFGGNELQIKLTFESKSDLCQVLNEMKIDNSHNGLKYQIYSMKQT